MRQLLPTSLLALLLATTSYAQQPPAHDLAKTRMVQGKYVFFHNQPVAPYDVAFSFGGSYTPNEKMTINTIVDGELAGALTEAGAQLKPFDAIIVQAGSSRDIAIKFKDSVPPADRALANVSRDAGKYVFVYCEPVADYKVVKTERPAWYNHLFGGAYYTTSQVESNLVKDAQKKPEIQAVVLTETASYITFK